MVKAARKRPAMVKVARKRTGRRRNEMRKQRVRPGRKEKDIVEQATLMDDEAVAWALADLCYLEPVIAFQFMQAWQTPILKVPLPGRNGRVPSKAKFEAAKRAVVRYFSREQRLGPRSHVEQAFRLASGEPSLRFDWEGAKGRVQRARLDRRRKIDRWKDCLAMSSGETNAQCEIWVCGTRKITTRALTSLLCHEGLHNLARRTRRGNSFLSEELEHIAMAFLGDPQLVNVDDGMG